MRLRRHAAINVSLQPLTKVHLPDTETLSLSSIPSQPQRKFLFIAIRIRAERRGGQAFLVPEIHIGDILPAKAHGHWTNYLIA